MLLVVEGIDNPEENYVASPPLPGSSFTEQRSPSSLGHVFLRKIYALFRFLRSKIRTVKFSHTHSDEEENKNSFIREFISVSLVAFILMFVVNNFLMHTYLIPSESMEDTLIGCAGCTNDRIIVDKLTYDFIDPRPGDVVVFKAPFPGWVEPSYRSPRSSNPLTREIQNIASWFGLQPPDEYALIKRVIAVGGQTIACSRKAGGITVNGKLIDEPYLSQSAQIDRKINGPCWELMEQNPIDVQKEKSRDHACLLGSAGNYDGEFGPIRVPEGNIFVMGDNRNNSKDSRFHILDGDCGSVPIKNVRGIARWIVYPWKRMGSIPLINPQSYGSH